ncbi:MAG: FRG domain-containing protein, partial [Candidatus Sumerlaeota bacterium]
MTQAISSFEGFVRKIRKVTPDSDEVLLYRGHSDRKNYKLVPSLLREQRYTNAEHTILRELVSTHPAEFAADSTTLEQLVRVQHYSLPTRLLDVTWNPLVGLYFAARNGDGPPAEVIVFRIKKEIVKFYDSDTASCIANLAHLSTAEKNSIDFNIIGDAFNAQPPVERLLQFIRVEKPHFRSVVDPLHLRTAI